VKLADQKYCYECAAVIRRDAEACRVCGAAQPELPPSRGPWPLERPSDWRVECADVTPPDRGETTGGLLVLSALLAGALMTIARSFGWL
jgi:hypothetical protein